MPYNLPFVTTNIWDNSVVIQQLKKKYFKNLTGLKLKWMNENNLRKMNNRSVFTKLILN